MYDLIVVEQPANPKPRRKRLRIALICLSVSILAILHVTLRMRAFDAELTSIQDVKARGVHVFGEGHELKWGTAQRLEALFHNLPYGVSFPESTTDKDLECLSSLKWLSDVRVEETQVTGSGLRLLARIPDLEILFIYDSRIAASDLELLQDFPSLKSVWVSFEQCTGVGIKALSRLRNVDFSLMCRKCNFVSGVNFHPAFAIEVDLWDAVARHGGSCEMRQKERATKEK